MAKNSVKTVLLACSEDPISKGIAYHLAKSGCRLVLLGNEEYLRKMAEEISSSLEGFDSFKIVNLNMEDVDGAVYDTAVHRAWKSFGSIDALVNCFNYEGKIQGLLEMSEDEFKKTVKVNFMAACYLLKSVAKRMKAAQTGGSVVLLSQILGAERGLYPGSAIYGSSLAAVQQLARLAALDLGKYDIRVNAVARGLHLDDPFPASVGKEKAQKSTSTVMPLKRWLDPKSDLASTVIYLVGDDSRYMTGTTIFVDGAQSLVRPRMRSYI